MKLARETVAAAGCVIAATIFMTWPQSLHMSTQIAAHFDPEFSIWRLGWVSHALATDPRHLFQANIFVPSPNALTFSDAMLLEGTLAAPLFWLKLSPILIYNLELLGGMAASGLAMFVLARRVTDSFLPALYAAVIFTMVPYRIEHYMHLELQWSMWIPLTFWAFERTLDPDLGTRWRDGILTGLFIWLQIASCVYYGVFLVMCMFVFATVHAMFDWRSLRRAVPALGVGALIALAFTVPYMRMYLGSVPEVGARDLVEIAGYSARPSSYLAAPPQNWLRGWSTNGAEVNLFLGWSVLAMSVVGAIKGQSARARVAYAAVAVTACTLSMGFNTPVYNTLLRILPGLRGLRSPSRFAIILDCAAAMLAGLGLKALRPTGRGVRWRGAVVSGAAFLLLFAEFANTGMFLTDLSGENDGPIYKVMKSIGPGVLLELPMPTAGILPLHEQTYERWSLLHWHPMVNGYSGYYSPVYMETLSRMQTFPDEDSVARLHRMNVRFIIVHCGFYDGTPGPQACSEVVSSIAAWKEFHSYGIYKDPAGAPAYLFVVER